MGEVSPWILVDLQGQPVIAVMTERIDGAFWLVNGKEIPAPRHGDWEIRQEIYREMGYQVAILEGNTPKIILPKTCTNPQNVQ